MGWDCVLWDIGVQRGEREGLAMNTRMNDDEICWTRGPHRCGDVACCWMTSQCIKVHGDILLLDGIFLHIKDMLVPFLVPTHAFAIHSFQNSKTPVHSM